MEKNHIKKGDVFKKVITSNYIVKCHVLAIIDKNQIVYKWFGRHKQWWHYEIENEEFIKHYNKRYQKILNKRKIKNENNIR